MDTLKTRRDLESHDAQGDRSPANAKDQKASEIRALGEWELVHVSGGEGMPVWP